MGARNNPAPTNALRDADAGFCQQRADFLQARPSGGDDAHQPAWHGVGKAQPTPLRMAVPVPGPINSRLCSRAYSLSAISSSNET